jgi:hypothetical protein
MSKKIDEAANYVTVDNAKVGDKVVKGGNYWSQGNPLILENRDWYGIVTNVSSCVHIACYDKYTSQLLIDQVAMHGHRQYCELSFLKEESITYDNNQKSGNQLKVRKSHPTISARDRRTGSSIQGRRIRTTTDVGHLSNQKIFG